MASVSVQPLIYGSLLATKVTLRFPRSIFRRRGSNSNEDVWNTDVGIGDGLRPSCDGCSSFSYQHNSEIGDPAVSDYRTSQDYADLNILFNCGWSLDFNRERLEFLKRNILDVDIIAITDGDFHHVGALPVLYSWLRGQRGNYNMPPVLFTEGSYKFARACLVDLLENATFSYKFDEYNATDLEYLYSGCSKLRYHESFMFTKTLRGTNIQIALLAMNNGVSIGGAIWKILAGSRNIICAPNYCAQPVWYLDGLDIRSLRKSDVFVTYDQVRFCEDFKFPYVHSCGSMRSIISTVAGTLRSHGSVLIPMDVGSSVIDLLLNLNTVWLNSDLQQYPIVLVSPIAVKLLLLFATCLEYMRGSFCRSFLRSLWNPIFNLRCIHPASTLDELRKFTSMPCVFITTCSSLSFGVTSYLFAALSSYERNSVIFTSDSADVRELLHKFEEEYSANDAFNHEFMLRLNLEPPEEHEDISMDTVDLLEEKANDDKDTIDVVMSQFEDELGSKFIHRKEHNFVTVNGQPTFGIPKIIRDDIDGYDTRGDVNLDYGIPYTSVSRADLHNSLDNSPPVMLGYKQKSEYTEILDTFSYHGKNHFNEYYREHLEDLGAHALMFDDATSTSPTDDHTVVSKLVTKRLPLVIKCGIYSTRYFQHARPRSELASLLREICPRRIAILPRSHDLDMLCEIEHFVRSSVEGFGECHVFTECLSHEGITNNISDVTFDRVLSIPLDMRHVLVNRSTAFLLALRNLNLASSSKNQDRPTLSGDLVINRRLERLIGVIESIDRWKCCYNPQKFYQAVVRIDNSDDYSDNMDEPVLKCFSFWSERLAHAPRLSLSSGQDSESQESGITCETDDATPNASITLEDSVMNCNLLHDPSIKHSVDRSLFTGRVSVPMFVRFIGECLPECTSIDRGVVNMNGRLCVSKSAVRYGVNCWSVRGTLDPAFYFSRKLLRKLHNRIEPLF